MTAEIFVTTLKSQAPDIKKFEALGLPDEYIKRTLSGYELVNKQSNLVYKDALLELVANYDLKSVEIGMVTFMDEILEDDSCYHVGNVEVDLLVKNKQSGIIQVLDFDQPSNLLWNCATNGSLFLDALLLCESYLTRRALDEDLYENDVVRSAMISESAEKAGGIEYIDFYEMLIG